jgi:hypothetical protein
VIRSTNINWAWRCCWSCSGGLDAARTRRTHQDPKALAIVEALEKAIAPENGWSKVGGSGSPTRPEGMEIISEYHHSWNVATGQYRVDWKTKDGDRASRCSTSAPRASRARSTWLAPAERSRHPVAARNTRDRGEVRRRPRRLGPGPPRSSGSASSGYERFINDTYWLLMPLKLRDPGVNLDYDGEKKIGKETYDVVRFSFDAWADAGDLYWVYVNRETHLDRPLRLLPSPAKPDWLRPCTPGRAGRSRSTRRGRRPALEEPAHVVDVEGLAVVRSGQAGDREDARDSSSRSCSRASRCCPRCRQRVRLSAAPGRPPARAPESPRRSRTRVVTARNRSGAGPRRPPAPSADSEQLSWSFAASDIIAGLHGGSHTTSTFASVTPARPRIFASTSGGRLPATGTSGGQRHPHADAPGGSTWML